MTIGFIFDLPESAKPEADPAPGAAQIQGLTSLSGICGKVLVELAGLVLELVGVGRRLQFTRDVRPFLGILPVHLQPLLGFGLGVRQNRLRRAFRFADSAIDALVGMNDEHVLAFIKTVHRTDFDAIGVLTLDAGFGDNIGHR